MAPGNPEEPFNTRRVLMSVFLGVIGFFLSPLGLQYPIDTITINLPWSVVFPIIAAMAFGWKYAIVAALSGGAFYPFLIWADNGWPNFSTSICYLLFFVAIGIAYHPSNRSKVKSKVLRLSGMISLFFVFLFLYFRYVYSAMVSFNPPFWADHAISSIDTNLLTLFFAKDFLSFTLLTIAADTIIRITGIRYLLGIKIDFSQRRNHFVVIATLSGSALIWASFFVLSYLLLDDVLETHREILLLSFFVICSSSFILARIIIFYVEKHQSFRAEIIEREKRAIQQRDALRKSEEENRSIVEVLPDMLFKLDKNGKYIDVKADSEDDLLYSRMDLLTKTISDVFPSDVSSLYIKKIIETIETGKIQTLEYKLTVPSGEKIFEGRIQRLNNNEVIAFVRDVTKQKKSEIALRESEQRFQDALEYMAVPIGITSGNKIIFHNQQYIKTFGYTVEDVPTIEVLISKIYPDVHYREFAQNQWERDFSEALAAGTSTLPRDYKIRCKNGEDKLVTIIGRQVGDLFVNVFHDITAKKAAEDALRESERRFHDALEYMAIPIGITSGDKIIMHNQEYLKTFGYTLDDVPSIGIWLETAYPDEVYREFVKKQWAKDVAEAIASNTNTVPRDYRIRCKNGDEKLVTIIGRAVGDIFVAVFHDITEKKATESALVESEQRYRNLFESANDAIFIISNGEIIDCNRKSLEMFGYEESSIAKMAPWSLSPEYQPDGTASHERAMHFLNRVHAGEAVVFDWIHTRKDQSEFEAEVSLNLLSLSNNDIVVAVVRDVSEKVQLKRDAQLNIFKGEEYERARLAKELHDGIGPLLSTCKIYLHTLGMKKIVEQDFESEKKKISELLDDALISVREISNNLSPHLVKNFGLVYALKNFTEKVHFAGKIDLKTICESNIRFTDTIETSLYRVITELINNSIKHASANTIQIEINCSSNNVLKVSYKDDGVGFDFSNVMSVSHGHGLPNIRSRIQSLKGVINIQSKPNNGIDVKIVVKY